MRIVETERWREVNRNQKHVGAENAQKREAGCLPAEAALLQTTEGR